MDDESSWQRQLLIGVLVLLVVGALIGGIFAFIGIKAADLAGLGETKPTKSRATIQIRPDATTDPSPRPSGGSRHDRPDQPTPDRPDQPKPPKPAPVKEITLNASPRATGTYQRVNLTGSYRAPEGTALQVQRKEGGAWVDFPTSASVSGGTFATYVETGRAGPNLFRVTDLVLGKSSNTVAVQIG